MWKIVFQTVVVMLLLGYLVVAVAFINPRTGGDAKCTALVVDIDYNGQQPYLNEKQVEAFVQNAGLHPKGKPLSAVSTEKIEKALDANAQIRSTKSYKTINGTVKVQVKQRCPILRVFSTSGQYYIDEDGKKMPIPANAFSAHVPVATGNIRDSLTVSRLTELANYIEGSSWDDEITQININDNGDVELIPRLGQHVILLGRFDHYKEKLAKLDLFYKEALNKVGWNRYSLINLKYDNQIVCTKRQ